MSRPIQTPPHMQQPRPRKARIAGIVAAALVISWGAPAANAYWQTLGGNPGGAKGDSILAVAAPTASASAGAAAVSWAQSTTAGGRAVSGYTIARYSSATGGAKVAAGGACAGTVTVLTCSEAALPAGTWYYTVTPVLASWAAVESARSGGVTAADTTAPDAPSINTPQPINLASAPIASVTGTAEAGSLVTVTVTDSVTQQHSAFKTASADAVTGQWTISNFDLRGLTDGIITYTATAKDAAGNVSVPRAVTSTKDTQAPTAKVTLGNLNGTAETGDTVSIKYSADIDSKSICSTWTNGVQPPDIAGNNVVTVTISNTNILTVTTSAGAACAPNIGPVALRGSYVTSGSLTFKGNSGNGTPSKVAWNDATQTLTITLGSRTGTANTGVAASSPTVAPPTGVTDTSGNPAISAAPDATSRF